MTDPKIIEPIIHGATYLIPTYKVMDDGLKDGPKFELKFCKGDKDDPLKMRQPGFFTETLIQACKEYIEANNVGPVACRENSMVITKLDEALLWIGKRAEDRKMRDVQGTYKP